ncbi:MAG: hypothetical protein HeimC2_05830 [Candidatus Heimdallarchaeota archaeon LC_2]|nr:MAG: hypothetical protein HeimC2_05830 [Candidatus Heimdallarchaeota archaeon LC_2]
MLITQNSLKIIRKKEKRMRSEGFEPPITYTPSTHFHMPKFMGFHLKWIPEITNSTDYRSK